MTIFMPLMCIMLIVVSLLAIRCTKTIQFMVPLLVFILLAFNYMAYGKEDLEMETKMDHLMRLQYFKIRYTAFILGSLILFTSNSSVAIFVYTPLIFLGYVGIDQQYSSILNSILRENQNQASDTTDQPEMFYLSQSLLGAAEVTIMLMVLMYLLSSRELNAFFTSQKFKKSKEHLEKVLNAQNDFVIVVKTSEVEKIN